MSTGTAFGVWLRAKRIAAGLSSNQLAILMDTSPSYIAALESGKIRRPRDRTIRALAGKLNLSVEEVFAASAGLVQFTNGHHPQQKLDTGSDSVATTLSFAVSEALSLSRQLVRTADGYNEQLVDEAVELFEKIRTVNHLVAQLKKGTAK